MDNIVVCFLCSALGGLTLRAQSGGYILRLQLLQQTGSDPGEVLEQRLQEQVERTGSPRRQDIEQSQGLPLVGVLGLDLFDVTRRQNILLVEKLDDRAAE